MKKNRVYIYVNGIKTKPGKMKNWNGRAVTATHVYHDRLQPKAEKVEYYTSALLRPLQQGKRAGKLIKCAGFYHDWEKVLVAHSNGADVVMDALTKRPFHVHHLHLISPANKADCDKNGINEMMEAGYVRKLTIWIAGKDTALGLASTWFGKMLGYGTLGRTGPVDAGRGHNIEIVKEPDYGHSTWFDPKNFNETMARIWNS